MALSNEWQEIKYKEVFEQETTGLTRRLISDPECKAEDLEAILKNLYIMEGANHIGRGPLQDTIMAATIAAYEHFIAKMKAKAQ
ncbi:hypothetical protein [Treponema sp. R80B11-R83G3]